ncbi:MAG: DNA replication/repair protein RecF [Candidatus Hydrogenedentes bacterium]|nr:DNA replication/repair protein RecF [Candidatus Hydrogenedentota bacterium]
MYLKNLFMKFFRCFSELNMEFSSGTNLILGSNAQGKTSLLEAIYFLALARSPRTNVEKEMVQYGCGGFLLKGWVEYSRSDSFPTRTKTIEIRWGKGKKKIIIDGIEAERVSELLGNLRVVFLSNDHFNLVTGGGSVKRRFLDIQISQWDREYLHALQEYNVALRQRNELLRRSYVTDEELYPWEVAMDKFSKIIVEARRKFLSKIAPFAVMLHNAITRDENLEIRYVPSIEGDSLLKVLQVNRKSDAEYGATQRGPHRDDIEIKINRYPVRQYASRGQIRTCSFALIIAQVYAMLEEHNEPPVLLADELLSELDSERSKKMVESIPKGIQSFITSADTSLNETLGLNASLYFIRKGKIEKAG